ncbi:MAG: ABC transporter ATP-binding protein [Oligoflexia bacterium]|nr:ABC transporter ATP-binding protein [Oligoflexia bacterium]
MFEIINLSTRVENFYLKDITFSVATDSIHMIIGPSGSGKTVLLETIAGFTTNNINISGEVRVDGVDVTNFPPERRNFSYVPQDLALFPHLNVEDNIFFGFNVRNVRGVKKVNQNQNQNMSFDFVIALAQTVGISSFFKRSIDSLSGGERQRVALVRALATGNRHLLLDEPFAGLHVGLKKELWFLLKEIQRKYKLTIIMVTHDIDEAFFLGEHISILIDGRIEQSGLKREARMPQTMAVARFYGLKNIFKAIVEDYSNNNDLNLYIPELKLRLSQEQLAFDLRKVQECLYVGIRSEDITFYDNDNQEAHPNIRGKIISYFEKDHFVMIFFKGDGLDTLMELEMPYSRFKNLGIKEVNLNIQQISLSIDTNYIFPIF